jgi:hypothetical protein
MGLDSPVAGCLPRVRVMTSLLQRSWESGTSGLGRYLSPLKDAFGVSGVLVWQPGVMGLTPRVQHHPTRGKPAIRRD